MGEFPGINDPHQKLNRLMGYLELDPENLNLIADACAMALDVALPNEALALLDQYEAIAPLPQTLLNLKGIAALLQRRFGDAAAIFGPLFAQTQNDAAVRFNLAWATSMTGDDARAVELLDTHTTSVVPGAALLKLESLHRLGDLERALDEGTRLAESRPDDTALMGALSLVAMDLEMPELARTWAARSQSTAEGLSTMGVLVLQDNHIDEALAFFERGLTVRPDSARNLLGKGLALLASGDAASAAKYIDQSAVIFDQHLGTWIASGWAHFAAGDTVRARAIFEHTLVQDDTFAESHGALAVLDILGGNIESARHRAETALRLDRRCLAGTLAQTLLLERAGDRQSAQRMRDMALNTPLTSGRTIAQSMIDIAPHWRKGNKR